MNNPMLWLSHGGSNIDCQCLETEEGIVYGSKKEPREKTSSYVYGVVARTELNVCVG